MVSTVCWLLDTNVLSEALRPVPNAGVMAQLARYEGELGIAAPVLHELRFGWLRMPEGRRKDAIGRYIQDVIAVLPVLAYDAAAARTHALLRKESEHSGVVIPFVDGQIAAIAISHGLTLVTRNCKDFSSIQGLRLENWFNEP
jgi:tRNA(fMet)-specific endonuclease VapC